MKKVLKWLGILLAGMLALLVIAAAGLAFAGTSKVNKAYEVEAAQIAVPGDEAALARGEHLVNVLCTDCHGADLNGQIFFDEPPLATAYASNLTGLAETHSDEDLVRAIRHGLDRQGRPLMIMPAESFVYFSEEDLGAIIAYLKTVPPQGEAHPPKALGPLGRVLMGAGMFDSSLPATYLDHETPFPTMPEVGANEAYGEYMSRFCLSCHGAELAGGQPPAPDAPPAPNLTPAGALGSWSEQDFINTMRTGVTPHGRQLDEEWMPWRSLGKLADEELSALWLYLQALEPRTTASQ